jgi:hypothetical protein
MREYDSQLADRTWFSFASSGWLYVYQLGVAKYLQDHVVAGGSPDTAAAEYGYSGSSGGALCAGILALDVPVAAMTDEVISHRDRCALAPWRMLQCTEAAMEKFTPPGAGPNCDNKLRIMLSEMRFPVPWPRVVTAFRDRAHLIEVMRASCHIPIIGGVLPRVIDGRWYYDGMFWPHRWYCDSATATTTPPPTTTTAAAATTTTTTTAGSCCSSSSSSSSSCSSSSSSSNH